MNEGRTMVGLLKRTLIGVVLSGALLPSTALAGTPASTADDVCAANANPCNVTSVFDVAPGATLDFGTRTVNVSGSGQFNFSNTSGKILCGPFSATTSGAAIDANGPAAGGGTESGSVTLSARRKCTGGDPQVPCVGIGDCQLGTCGVRRCSLRPAKICNSDQSCQLGTCGANRRCSGSATFVRCATNADCDYGTCPQQLTCSNRAENPVSCAANADCDFGTCTVGAASIVMGGSIVGNSNSPASITLRAADNVTVTKTINISSGSTESDGGDLSIESAAGFILLSGKVNAEGGGTSQGGTVELYAETDVTVTEEIDVVGGDFDGGGVDIEAGRDVTISKSILANSQSGAGFGGEILLDAGRDLVINGGSPSNKTTIETNGNTDDENFAGDGGTQDYAAGRNMTMEPNTRFIGLGSQPDGTGSDIFVDVTEDLTMDGDITAKALGGQGGGGYVEILTSGAMSVGTSGTFDVTGGGGGGFLEFDNTGNVAFGGFADASGGVNGSGGSVFLDSAANTTLSGTLFVNDPIGGGGSLEVDACRITVTGTGKLDNKVSNGDNTLLVRESMKLESGSLMGAGASGKNTLIYRTASKPPVTSGTITPAPIKVVDTKLIGCPVCGNSEIDDGETCDDGNVNNGDGCSSFCQNENCLAQTISPGFPTVALCEDGNVCTADICNTSVGGGTCQHPSKDCSDAFACTTDSCDPGTGVCLHTPNDGSCNDQNPCTDDFCSVQTGCSGVANNDPCNDGDGCTENDQCSGSTCQGTPIDGCAVCGDGIATPPEPCDDGNNTFTSGEYCGVDCVLIPCGKPTNSSGDKPKASDALFILKAAVGQASCTPQVCDVDSSGKILASDALRALRSAVGQTVVLICPAV